MEVIFLCMIAPEYSGRRSELEFKILVRSEVLTVMLTKIPAFWDMRSCRLVQSLGVP